MKTKKGKSKKGSGKAALVGKDDWGFLKGSKSSQAVKLLASGKSTKKETRKRFNTLSFGKLLSQLEKNGFKVAEDAQGLCSVIAKAAKGSRVRHRPPIETPPPVEKVALGSTL